MRTRLATLADAEAIREIYNLEVTTSTVTFDLVPRTPAQQEEWLAKRSGAHAVIVAEDTGQVVGFAALSPYRDRGAYATTVEDSVYVARAHQGRGIGKLLLGDLIEVARQRGFHAMMARIVGGHEASIGLHRSMGFWEVGVEREVGRKFGQWLDVVLMQRMLS
ncbi:MAG TPA: GNAT family N-acetyltransferase [Acidimicrobiales bacterium]